MILAVDDAGWCPVRAATQCSGRRRVHADAVLALIASAALLAVSIAQSSAAGLYRCIDGNGIVAYSVQPCAGSSARPLAVDSATHALDYPTAPLGAPTPGSGGPLVVSPAGTGVVRPAPRSALAADPATGQILAPTGNQLVDPVTGTLWMRSGDHYVDPATGRSIPAR